MAMAQYTSLLTQRRIFGVYLHSEYIYKYVNAKTFQSKYVNAMCSNCLIVE